MTAAELREALALISSQVMVIHTGLSGDELDAYVEAQSLIDDAARAIALPILEADPELVERIAKTIKGGDSAGMDYFRRKARAVLAAITSPTDSQ